MVLKTTRDLDRGLWHLWLVARSPRGCIIILYNDDRYERDHNCINVGTDGVTCLSEKQ